VWRSIFPSLLLLSQRAPLAVEEEWSRDVMRSRSSVFVNDTIDHMQHGAACIPSHDLVYVEALPLHVHTAFTHMETLLALKSVGGERIRAAIAQGVLQSWWAAAVPPPMPAPASSALRLGVLSSDLKLSHPIGQLLLPIIDALHHAGGITVSCLVIRRVKSFATRHTAHIALNNTCVLVQVGMKDISNEFQQSYGRVCRGGLDVFESADTIETAQRINAMQLMVLLWINGWTSEATAALLIPRPAPVQMAWLGNPSFAVTKLVQYLVSGALMNTLTGFLPSITLDAPLMPRHRVISPRSLHPHPRELALSARRLISSCSWPARHVSSPSKHRLRLPQHHWHSRRCCSSRCLMQN
jgi:hypothetical protein